MTIVSAISWFLAGMIVGLVVAALWDIYFSHSIKKPNNSEVADLRGKLHEIASYGKWDQGPFKADEMCRMAREAVGLPWPIPTSEYDDSA